MTQQSFFGFEPANTTAVPDILFDELLSELSGAELKVLLYVIRRTWGFKKDTDAISLTQFEKGIVTQEGKILDKGCGLARETICNALQSLEKRGCIKSKKRTAHKKDKDVTLYSIRWHDEEVVGKSDQPSQKSELPTWSENLTTVVGTSDQGSRKNPKKVVGKSDLQETVIQDTDSQETVIQENRVGAAVADTTRTTASSSSQSKALSSSCPLEDTTVVTATVQPLQEAQQHSTPSYSRTTHTEQRETIRSENVQKNAHERTPEKQNSRGRGKEQPRRGRAESKTEQQAPPSRRSKQTSPPVVMLTAEGQAFYDLYCSMPWIVVPPKITELLSEQCSRLAPHLKTQERLIKLRNWMNADRWYKGKGFSLGMIERALNDWLMTQIDVVPAKPPEPAPDEISERDRRHLEAHPELFDVMTEAEAAMIRSAMARSTARSVASC